MNIKEHGPDSDSGINEPICLQGKFVSSSGIINASKTVLPPEMESSRNQEIISLDTGSVVSVPIDRDQGLSMCVYVDENAPVQRVAVGYTGSGESLPSHQLTSLDSCTDNPLSLNSDNLTSFRISKECDFAASMVIDKAKKENMSSTSSSGTVLRWTPLAIL